MEVSGLLHAPPALPSGESRVTHWTGGWVSLRAGLDAETKKPYHWPSQDLNPGRPARSLVSMYTD